MPLFRVVDSVNLNSLCTIVTSLAFFCVHDLMYTCLTINDYITKPLFTAGIADCVIFIYRRIVGRHIHNPLILVLSRVLDLFRPRRSINDPLFLVNSFLIDNPLFRTPHMLMITRFRCLDHKPLSAVHSEYSPHTSNCKRQCRYQCKHYFTFHFLFTPYNIIYNIFYIIFYNILSHPFM